MEHFDVLVSGGGPGGAAAAWRASSLGAKVLVCDKAQFPRDKPCGDGITPRGVRWLREMGLGDDLDRLFHRVDSLRVVSHAGTIERPWPARDGLPGHGYVAARTVLDELVLDRAAKAGAEIRQGCEVMAPIVEDGAVRGAVVRTDGNEVEIRADVTVAADGMTSRLRKAIGMQSRENAPFAVAVRAQVDSGRPDDGTLECHVTMRHGRGLLPGYGWVFPMGGGRINVGIGYMSSFRGWKDVKANQVMTDFVAGLPKSWNMPSVPEMVRAGQLNGWRLPVGLAVWPPWRPGLVAVGDAIGAAKPYTGAGISKALESGVLASDAIMHALSVGDARDLSGYERMLRHQWGNYYRLGRHFARVIGRPAVMRGIVGAGMRSQGLADSFLALFTGNGNDVGPGRGLPGKVARGVVRITGVLPERDERPPEPVEVRSGAQRLVKK